MSASSSAQSHYQVLGILPTATAAQIKHAYHQLAKQHHPDIQDQPTASSDETMRQINAAYEVLGHQESRRAYDHQRQSASRPSTPRTPSRGVTLTDEATAQALWVQQVYAPVNRLLSTLFRSLRPQLNALAADPFDDQLLEQFCLYLDTCTAQFCQAQQIFQRYRNPSSLAGVASLLYYTLNHMEDALEELQAFPLNYEDRHLHTGQELFRRAHSLRLEAVNALEKHQIRF